MKIFNALMQEKKVSIKDTIISFNADCIAEDVVDEIGKILLTLPNYKLVEEKVSKSESKKLAKQKDVDINTKNQLINAMK